MPSALPSSARRVAYLTPWQLGADPALAEFERHLFNLARAVASGGGWEVEIVAYEGDEETRSPTLGAGVELRRLTAEPDRPGSWDLLEAVLDVDLVHVHGIFTRASELALLIARLACRPVCVSDSGPRTSQLGRSLGMLELAESVVAFSRCSAAGVAEPDRTTVIPGGVDDQFFTPLARQARREHILFVGRPTPVEELHRLIAAMPDDLPVVVCGAREGAGYAQLIDRLAVGRPVSFIDDPSEAELRALYRRAIAVVAAPADPGAEDTDHGQPGPLGLGLLEGMACAAPVICPPVGPLSEWVQDGISGLHYADLAGLTNAIDRLAADRSFANRLGAEGRRQVEEHYGLAPTGVALGELYDQILSDQRRAAGHRRRGLSPAGR